MAKKKLKPDLTILPDSESPIELVFHDPTPTPPPPILSASEAESLRRLLAERARRSLESLRLYEPLPLQDAFHASLAPERVLRGSNRGGKTLPAAIEVARAVTGKDPYGKWPETDGRFMCVGKDNRHLAQVMWHKLSRAGAFKMIRDQVSGDWRAYRPWDLADAAREKQAKPAPPLIPPRLIKEISWENKKDQLPRLVTLHNGWELSFHTSAGDPPNGVDVDGVWFDEEIVNEYWYPEMAARLLDRSGRFFWSATPQSGTETLFSLHEKAEQQAGKPNPDVTEHVILLSDNPHISTKQKRLLASKLTAEERQIRIGGEFVLLTRKIFPEYDPYTHGVKHRQVPADWSRFMIVDPGHNVCAVMFAAVPSPHWINEHPNDRGVWLYDELYLQNCNATMFADEVAVKVKGQTFVSFIIDHQGGKITDIGSGKNVEAQYSDALGVKKVKSINTGNGFIWGSSDIKGGLLAIHEWLRIREDGLPWLRVISENLPNFEQEMKFYRKKVVNKIVREEPDPRSRSHMIDCLRYLAMYDPKWTAPPTASHIDGSGYKMFQRKLERKKARHGGSRMVNLGPGSNVA